jgi:hypothetical protein
MPATHIQPFQQTTVLHLRIWPLPTMRMGVNMAAYPGNGWVLGQRGIVVWKTEALQFTTLSDVLNIAEAQVPRLNQKAAN